MKLKKEKERQCKKCGETFTTKVPTRQCLKCRSKSKKNGTKQSGTARVRTTRKTISNEVKEENQNNPFFKTCCVIDCTNKDIEWHHPLQYAGRQITDIVVPLCVSHHRGENGTISLKGKNWGELWAITIHRKTLITDYPKYDWMRRKQYLQNVLKTNI